MTGKFLNLFFPQIYHQAHFHALYFRTSNFLLFEVAGDFFDILFCDMGQFQTNQEIFTTGTYILVYYSSKLVFLIKIKYSVVTP